MKNRNHYFKGSYNKLKISITLIEIKPLNVTHRESKDGANTMAVKYLSCNTIKMHVYD